MKICYDYQAFYNQKYGGVSRYHIELANRISRFDDCEVIIPSLWNDNEYLGKCYHGEKNLLYKCIKHRFSRTSNRLYTRAYLYLNDCDILHPTWVDSYVWKIKTKAKIVITVHDMIHELFWKDKVPEEIERKKIAIFKSDLIITISDNTKKDILSLYPCIPESKIKVVFHGTSHLPNPKYPIDFDVPHKYVLYVGGRQDYKQGMFAVNAFKYMLNEFPDMMLVCVGGGEFTAEENALIHKNKLQYNVIQRNVTDEELAYLYKHALCFIYPSLYEGFGLPILEAFDNRCPVICANNSSLPEVGGNAVLYFENYDAYGLCQQIRKLVLDEGLRENLITKGAHRVEKFSWDKCAKETYELYRNLCKDY